MNTPSGAEVFADLIAQAAGFAKDAWLEFVRVQPTGQPMTEDWTFTAEVKGCHIQVNFAWIGTSAEGEETWTAEMYWASRTQPNNMNFLYHFDGTERDALFLRVGFVLAGFSGPAPVE